MSDEENAKKKNKTYPIRIGELLKKVLDKQKELINRAGYGCLAPSYLEAGEVLATKIINEKLV